MNVKIKGQFPDTTPTNIYCSFIAKHSGKCLDVSGESRENDANVQEWDWSGGDKQKSKLTVVEVGV